MIRWCLPLLLLTAAAPEAPRTKSCVNLRQVREQRIVDDHTILFEEGARWYRNDLGSACPGLRPDRAISTRTPGTSLCRGDLVTVFDPPSRFTYGACPLGKFTQVERPARSARR